MLRSFVLSLLLLLPFALAGCGENNSDAPPDNQAHGQAWIETHAEAAVVNAQFIDCTGCHGEDLTGAGKAVSCFSCHAFNTAPPFTIHPAYWTDPYNDHRGSKVATTCASCHGPALRGSTVAPSCFSTSVDGRSCHAAGPGLSTHPLDGSYLDEAQHGPDAKADLALCQGCHGQPGGPGSNPRFNLGIASQGGTGCEACHGINYAHPASWISPVEHPIAGNIPYACSLCHGVDLDGKDAVGVSCGKCHSIELALS